MNYYDQTPTTYSAKERGIYYLLWCLFGLIGGHQFYLGRNGRALSYILTFAWGTVGLWIDLFSARNQVNRSNAGEFRS